jgi:hypothetical protein
MAIRISGLLPRQRGPAPDEPGSSLDAPGPVVNAHSTTEKEESMGRHRFLYGVAALTFVATFFAAGCQSDSTPAVANGVVVPAIAAQATALVNAATAAEQAKEHGVDLSHATLGVPEAWGGGAECVTPEGAPFVAESC